MSMFGNITAQHIRKDIEKKIVEIKKLSEMDPRQVKHIVKGLELAKDIAESYED